MGQVGGCGGGVVGGCGLGRGKIPNLHGWSVGNLLSLPPGLPDRPPAPPIQGTFQQMWISKQEYEEGGKQCVERKCP